MLTSDVTKCRQMKSCDSTDSNQNGTQLLYCRVESRGPVVHQTTWSAGPKGSQSSLTRTLAFISRSPRSNCSRPRKLLWAAVQRDRRPTVAPCVGRSFESAPPYSRRHFQVKCRTAGGCDRTLQDGLNEKGDSCAEEHDFVFGEVVTQLRRCLSPPAAGQKARPRWIDQPPRRSRTRN
jgi:hypothetical protein